MGILISQVGNFDFVPSEVTLRYSGGTATIDITVPPGEVCDVYWGDTSGNSFLEGVHTGFTHTYSGTPPEGFTVRVAGKSSYLKFSGDVVEVLSFGSDPSLTVMELVSTVLTDVPSAISPYFTRLNLAGCTALNDPHMSSWMTAGLTNMNSMFMNCAAFNQNIDGWDVSNVTDMNNLFYGATVFNQPLNSWDTSSVVGNGFVGTFRNAAAFNQPLDNWVTTGGTAFAFMFNGATAFNQNVNTWDVSNATSFASMFFGASAFNQPLNLWNTASAVTTAFNGMFRNAAAFNQDIGGWDTSEATNMGNMFNGAAAFAQDLSGWCVPLIASEPTGFATGAGALTPPVWGTCP